VSFTPSGGTGANSLALAQGAATSASTLFLELRANQVNDLFGVAFDLSYPRGTVTFTRATEGTFLSGAGGTSLQVAEPSPGNLVVGHSRLGQQAGAAGSGVLVTFEFAVGSNGSGNIAFSRNAAFAADGSPQTGIAWGAGSVQVSR
jgi:hypothetical protein